MSKVMTLDQLKEAYRFFMESMAGKVSDEDFEKMWTQAQGDKKEKEATTPKILLDNGETVYGCQTWWEPIEP